VIREIRGSILYGATGCGLIRVVSMLGFCARVFKAIESQIWENVIPTVVTICILWFLLEAAGEEVFTLEK
jgi:hypothetical protein